MIMLLLQTNHPHGTNTTSLLIKSKASKGKHLQQTAHSKQRIEDRKKTLSPFSTSFWILNFDIWILHRFIYGLFENLAEIRVETSLLRKKSGEKKTGLPSVLSSLSKAFSFLTSFQTNQIFKKSLYFISFILLSSCLSTNSYAQLIEHQDEKEFLYGVNLPWHHYGWDFGIHPWWGSSYQPAYFEQTLAQLAEHGVNTLRMWVHCDGRASPEFDEEGYVTGLDHLFLAHLSDFLNRAHHHEIQVILCLWSFEMTTTDTDYAGPFAGNHADLLTDFSKTESYIENALIPLVQRFQHHPNILAWEIINEPEWAMDIGTQAITQQVPANAMQQFIGKCAAAIHQTTNHQHKVTVGAQSLEWNTDIDRRRITKNYWSDASFAAIGLDPKDAYLDFYSIHYYDWMHSAITPYHHDIDHWDLNKPVLISETPALCESMDWSVYQQLHYALHRGYAGLIFWSYGADDGFGSWDCMGEEIHYFSEMDPIRVTEETFQTQFTCHPNPVTTNQLTITFNYERLNDLNIRLFNITGQLLHEQKVPLVEQGDQIQMPFANIPNGIYIIELNNKLYFAQQKIIVQ